MRIFKDNLDLFMNLTDKIDTIRNCCTRNDIIKLFE